MALSLPMAGLSLPSRTPIAQAPAFARDAQELQLVISAQDAEMHALQLRLAEGNRECATLRQWLRESTDELHATAEATANAAERLEAHQGRQGLVLAAEAERCSAERAALEDELRRMEQLLCERDQEISRLRRAHADLQASRLQGDIELTGLAVVHEKTNSEVRAFGAGVQELRQKLSSDGHHDDHHHGPSMHETFRMDELVAELAAKQAENVDLSRMADTAAGEAKQLEMELLAIRERVRVFERDLRIKQERVENHDHRLVREAAAVRAQCELLRRQLHEEQRQSAIVDQRAILEERCGAEADGVRQEVHSILGSIRGLASTLRSRGLSVVSPEVPSDPVDVAMHVFLRSSAPPGPGGAPRPGMPPVVWRLAPCEYLIGEDRVRCDMEHGMLMVRDPGNGRLVPIRQVMGVEAARIRPDFAGMMGASH